MLTSVAGSFQAGGFSAFDLSSRKTVVAAVSGGGDSLALLLLLQAHLERCAPATKLVAVTVDHRLRPGSAIEAQEVAALCKARGIDHLTLVWEGEKPATGISAAAREARYRLLAEAARGAGTDLVLAGHTLDDQAETVLMRNKRGEGFGLAGMAPATLYDSSIWVCRPLLGQTREALRTFLREQGVPWIDDPSNENTAYERIRARQEIGASADPDAFKRALVSQAAEVSARRIALGEDAALLIHTAATQVSPGLIRIEPDHLRSAPSPIAIYALRLLLAAIGGGEHLPDEPRTRAFLNRILAGPCRTTLSGAVVDARKAGIFLHREFRGDGPAPPIATDGAVWDGRFRISLSSEAMPGPVVRAAGGEGEPQAPVPDSAPQSLVRAALATQPFPAAGIALVPLVAPNARFLPSFDLAPAQALAKLLRARAFPPPPFAGHNPP